MREGGVNLSRGELDERREGQSHLGEFGEEFGIGGGPAGGEGLGLLIWGVHIGFFSFVVTMDVVIVVLVNCLGRLGRVVCIG